MGIPRTISREGREALQAVVAAQAQVLDAEQTVASRRAQRDAALREAWRQRVPQSALADALGVSLTRAGDLSRRARERT